MVDEIRATLKLGRKILRVNTKSQNVSFSRFSVFEGNVYGCAIFVGKNFLWRVLKNFELWIFENSNKMHSDSEIQCDEAFIKEYWLFKSSRFFKADFLTK